MNVRNIVDEDIAHAVPIRLSGMRKELTCKGISLPEYETVLREALQVSYVFPAQVSTRKNFNPDCMYFFYDKKDYNQMISRSPRDPLVV